MLTPIYWIHSPMTHGQLGTMPRPRGGDWLEDEITAQKRAGVDVIVSALTEPEITELELVDEKRWCAGQGIGFISHPIPDRGTPESLQSFTHLVLDLTSRLKDEKKLVIHCRQGIGRASLIAAGALVGVGLHADEALAYIEASRQRPVPDTFAQVEWLRSWERVFQMDHLFKDL